MRIRNIIDDGDGDAHTYTDTYTHLIAACINLFLFLPTSMLEGWESDVDEEGDRRVTSHMYIRTHL